MEKDLGSNRYQEALTKKTADYLEEMKQEQLYLQYQEKQNAERALRTLSTEKDVNQLNLLRLEIEQSGIKFMTLAGSTEVKTEPEKYAGQRGAMSRKWVENRTSLPLGLGMIDQHNDAGATHLFAELKTRYNVYGTKNLLNRGKINTDSRYLEYMHLSIFAADPENTNIKLGLEEASVLKRHYYSVNSNGYLIFADNGYRMAGAEPIKSFKAEIGELQGVDALINRVLETVNS